MQNLLQFKFTDLTQIIYEPKTKSKSLVFGRRLYQFQFNQQRYWLKAQVSDSSPEHVASFGREIELYQLFNQASTQNSITLPFQVIKQSHLSIQQESIDRLLILPNAEPWFVQPASNLSLAQVRQVLWQALDVVERLSLHGWIHADLKQEHFVNWQGQCRLIDFEQALPLEFDQLDALTATPRYMAPELFHGQAKSLHSDIYALGIIFLEWLTSQRLEAKNYEDWAYLHCQRLKLDLPLQYQGFTQLLQHMLMKQKNDRLVDFYRLKSDLVAEFA
ncbi:protein kinase [Acinetobacter sp. YH12097]|uniref:protein kinase domain-containing protein n=1 Tax=Acinetobacter sp. YH12097 TaxID=2601086 RepID=UPI0015D44D6B|nr:protein kinase [Acinetobacter sp. YH12097]